MARLVSGLTWSFQGSVGPHLPSLQELQEAYFVVSDSEDEGQGVPKIEAEQCVPANNAEGVAGVVAKWGGRKLAYFPHGSDAFAK